MSKYHKERKPFYIFNYKGVKGTHPHLTMYNSLYVEKWSAFAVMRKDDNLAKSQIEKDVILIAKGMIEVLDEIYSTPDSTEFRILFMKFMVLLNLTCSAFNLTYDLVCEFHKKRTQIFENVEKRAISQ